MVLPILLYGLYKLTNRNDETKAPEAKVEEPAAPTQQPNRHHQNSSVIPEGIASISSETRDVFIASRVVGGGAGDGALALWEKYSLGAQKAILTGGLTLLLDDSPDPTHHWCVVVGDYLHQLQATSLDGGWNYYTNERFSMSGGWTKYKMGVTSFNDIAIRNSASKAINEMPEVYNVLTNNCQHFTLRLLDKVLRDGRKKVKMLNQTYGQMRQEPMLMPKPVKVYKIGEEPSADENEEESEAAIESKPMKIEPRTVKAPKLEHGEDDDEGDEDGEIAVVANEEDHLQMINEAVAIMIQNTPSMREAMATEEKAAE